MDLRRRAVRDDLTIPDRPEDGSVCRDVFPLEADLRGRGSDVLRSLWADVLTRSMRSPEYDYITGLRLHAGKAESHFERGLLLDILGYDDLATVEYSEAIEIDPRNDRYFNNRGNCYMVRGLSYLAVLDFTRAIEINPARAEPYYNRGRALERLGKSSDAQRDYRRAVELGICDKLPSLKICR